MTAATRTVAAASFQVSRMSAPPFVVSACSPNAGASSARGRSSGVTSDTVVATLRPETRCDKVVEGFRQRGDPALGQTAGASERLGPKDHVCAAGDHALAGRMALVVHLWSGDHRKWHNVRHPRPGPTTQDRKSIRLNSSHASMSLAVFWLI